MNLFNLSIRRFKAISCLCLFISLHNSLAAAVFPKEGGQLNYRLIGFSLPFENLTGKYKIEIAPGYFNNADSFTKDITVSAYGPTNKIIGEVPSFGSQYTWQATYVSSNGAIKKSALYHFTTGQLPVVDSTQFRVRIIKHTEKYRDATIFNDALGILYDIDGRPIWYMPGVKYESYSVLQPRDIKLSPFGTITYLIDSKIYEINYNGDTLWSKTSSNGGSKYPDNVNFDFHHQFSRLKNGHYMALGSENVLYKPPTFSDTNLVIVPPGSVINDSSAFKKKGTGDLIEYDEQGNIVWMWKSIDYIKTSDLKYFCVQQSGLLDLHDNAFYFDNKDSIIYISFKNVDRIVKVKYPEGNVLNFYGNKYNKDGVVENNLFHCQHAIKRSDNGYLYMFDNGCNTTTDPKLLLIREPTNINDSLKVLWQYECEVDDTLNKTKKGENPGGGNVKELPDSSIFVCMGLRNSIVFIVNLDKEVLWTAIAENWNDYEKKWTRVLSYRSSIITNRKDLERLIWNSEEEKKPLHGYSRK